MHYVAFSQNLGHTNVTITMAISSCGQPALCWVGKVLRGFCWMLDDYTILYGSFSIQAKCLLLENHLRVFTCVHRKYVSIWINSWLTGNWMLEPGESPAILKSVIEFTLMMLAHRNSWPENGRSWLRWTGAAWQTRFQSLKSKGWFKQIAAAWISKWISV